MMKDFLQRLYNVQSDDPDIIRRARGLISLCATAYIPELAFGLLNYLSPPSIHTVPSHAVTLALFVLQAIVIVVTRQGRVDLGGTLMGAGLSLLAAAYIGYVRTYTYFIWFMNLGIVIGSIAVKPRLIWAITGLNLLSLVALFLYIPTPVDDPLDKMRLNVQLSAMMILISLITYTNATRLRSLFHAKQAHLMELELAKQELAAALSASQEGQLKAEAASRAKSTFLANMSHELRTPLNAIIGYAELIHEDLEPGDPAGEGTLADLQKIERSGKHLLSLIDDVLDLSRIEAGKLSVSAQRLELEPLLEELAHTLEPMLAKNDNALIIERPSALEPIYSDPMRVKQILLNLLSNAAKFTQRGQVTLSVEQQAEHTKITVCDTGIGMDEQTLSRVFEEFVQADESTTRKYGGTGLGLPLSKKLAQLLGAEFIAKSSPGEGSSFCLCLPRRRSTGPIRSV